MHPNKNVKYLFQQFILYLNHFTPFSTKFSKNAAAHDAPTFPPELFRSA